MRTKNLPKLLVLIVILGLTRLGWAQNITINLRPSHVDISEETSTGAVLVTLSGYSSDDARYRLYSGSNQYNCWNPATSDWVTSNSYATGPQVPGTPTTSTTFWIAYQRGSNNSTVASYRDRLNPYTSDAGNNVTQALPSATAITSPASINQSEVTFTSWNTYTQKYVVLGYNQAEGGTLIAATSTSLSTGNFSLVIPDNVLIQRIEVRTLLNELVESVTGTWPATNMVMSPMFSPSGGTFYGPVEVSMASNTPDATIYYTTNGNEPTEASSLYEGPITISATTTLKARAFKAGLDPSAISTAVYTFQTADVEFGSLAELREWDPEEGHIYKLASEAIVVYPRVARGQKFIQDATGAILIDDPDGIITTPYAAGDGMVGLTGTLALFNGLLQFTPVLDPGAPSSTGNEIVIEEKTLASLTFNDQAKLIRVPNLHFDATGNFTIATDFDISDPTGAAKFRTTFSESNYVDEAIPAETLSYLVAFVLYDTSAGYRLVSRNWDDFVFIGTDATLSSLTLGGVETVGLVGIVVDNPETDTGAKLFVPNLDSFVGLAASTNHSGATFEVFLNGTVVPHEQLPSLTFAYNDVVVVTVTSQDGENVLHYKVTIGNNPSQESEIVDFTVPNQHGQASINTEEATVNVNVYHGTDVTSLVPTITVSNFATVNPASGVSQNFTSPVTYTVTAEDGNTKEWTVSVTILEPLSEAEILTFSVAAQVGAASIDSEAGTVSISVPYGTNVSPLIPTITVSPFATISPASGTAQDFANPVTYTVTAQDETTEKLWTVTVTVLDPPTTSIYDIQYSTASPADSPYANQVVFTTGVVTTLHYAWEGTPNEQIYKGYFIQDGAGAWNGIRVYETNNTNPPQVGDLVRVKGTVKEQFGNTEITSVKSETVILSSGNALPAASLVTTLNANNEEWEGVLIRVKNANCTNANAGFGMAILNDGSGEIKLDDDIYDFNLTQGTAYNVTGVVYYSFDEQKILPRSASDISVYSSIMGNDWKSAISAYPNPFGSSITLDNVATVTSVRITNLIGQQVVAETNSGNSRLNIDTEKLPQGIYLVTLENATGEKTIRKMVKR